MSNTCSSNADCSSGSTCVGTVCKQDQAGLPLIAWIGIGIGAFAFVVLVGAFIFRWLRMRRHTKIKKDNRLSANPLKRQGPAPLPAGYMKPVDLLQVVQAQKRQNERSSIPRNQASNSFYQPQQGFQSGPLEPVPGQKILLENQKNSYMSYMQEPQMNPGQRYSYTPPPPMYSQDYTGREWQSSQAVPPINQIPMTVPINQVPVMGQMRHHLAPGTYQNQNQNYAYANYHQNHQMIQGSDNGHQSITYGTPYRPHSIIYGADDRSNLMIYGHGENYSEVPISKENSAANSSLEKTSPQVNQISPGLNKPKMQQGEGKMSLILDVSQIKGVGSYPASPSRSTPLIEFSPAKGRFNSTENAGKIRKIPTQSEVSDGFDNIPLMELKARSSSSDQPHNVLQSAPEPVRRKSEIEPLKISAPNNQSSETSVLLPLRSPMLSDQMNTLFSELSSTHSQESKSPVTQRGNSSEFVDGVKNPTSPKFTENLASPILSDQMNTLFSELSSTHSQESKSPVTQRGVKNPTSPEFTENLASPILSDQMNTLFSELSASDTDISESPVSPAITDTSEFVNGIQNLTLLVESQRVKPSSNNSSKNGEPVEPMNPPSTNASVSGASETSVEPSSDATLKDSSTVPKRVRPSGGRPMPTHMKFS